jgi:hypothetical protein
MRKEGRKNLALKLEGFGCQKASGLKDTPPVVTPAKGKSFDCSIGQGWMERL